jgi:hypothetical protein
MAAQVDSNDGDVVRVQAACKPFIASAMFSQSMNKTDNSNWVFRNPMMTRKS